MADFVEKDGDLYVRMKDLVAAVDTADKFFNGELIMVRKDGVWTVMLGLPPIGDTAAEELLKAAKGDTLGDALAEALRRAAPLSEE